MDSRDISVKNEMETEENIEDLDIIDLRRNGSSSSELSPFSKSLPPPQDIGDQVRNPENEVAFRTDDEKDGSPIGPIKSKVELDILPQQSLEGQIQNLKNEVAIVTDDEEDGSSIEEGQIQNPENEVAISTDDEEDGSLTGPIKSKNELVTLPPQEVEEDQIQNPKNEVTFSTDDEEDGGPMGPIKSKNELDTLPPVPNVDVVLELHHQMLPVGVVSSIIGSSIIINGSVKHSPLTEGSILFITETRSPLGLVDEIFGPVKNPYYIIRFNSDREVPAGVHEGMAISFVVEFSGHIIDEKSLYKKGYDASGENDEELNDEMEFSDDEKEAEYMRSQRKAKRGKGNVRHAKHDKSNVKKIQFKDTGFQKKLQHVPHLAADVTLPVPCTPGQPETQSIMGNPGLVGSLCSSASSAASFGSGSSVAPLTSHLQSGCFIGGQQQNLPMQQPNTIWGVGVSPPQQQNIRSIMNSSSCQQLNDNYSYQNQPYQQQQHQNVPYSGFPNGIVFQQPFVSNQGPLPNFGFNMPLPYIETVGLGALSQGCFNQAPFGCDINKFGVPHINNGVQYFGQLPSASVQGGTCPPMQFNMGASTTIGSSAPNTSSGSMPSYNSSGRRRFGKR